MTPLKPIEAMKDVHAVAATRYLLNTTCAHPECSEPVDSAHHIFGRFPGENGDSWFVEVADTALFPVFVTPHVIGLCGSGTTKHHGDIEDHRAWIKYEDGEFVWYERTDLVAVDDEWLRLGPIDPQPGRTEKVGAKKPGRPRKSAGERRTRRTVSLSVPQGFAEGGLVWDELFGTGKKDIPLGRVREVLGKLRDEDRDPETGKQIDKRPEFELIVDMANDWLNSQ